MRIKSSVMIGVLVSVMTVCAAFADSVVTSKSYVDAQDALKQNKIPVSGTNITTRGNSIITYTDTAGQIGERELITEPEMLYDIVDGHIEYPGSPAVPTAGAVSTILQALGARLFQVENSIQDISSFQTRIPLLDYGSVVTYGVFDENGQAQFGKLDVFSPDDIYDAGTDAGKLATMGAVMASIGEFGEQQPALSGPSGSVVTYGDAPGVTGERGFLSGNFRNNTSGNADKLVTADQIYYTVRFIGSRPVSVMECTDPSASDDECLLWHISQRGLLSDTVNHLYVHAPFIDSRDYPSYEPYNP